MPSGDVILEGARLDQLAELLEARAVPFSGLDLEALDGFFSALAVSPEAVAEDDCLRIIWGGAPPRWNDDTEAADVMALLDEHRALCAQRVCYGEELPDRLLPLIWLPEDRDAGHPDALDIGRDWAHGFLSAVALCEPAWAAWMDAHEWIEDALLLLDQLASGEAIVAAPAASPVPAVGYRQRLALVASVAGVLADLHAHRIDMLTSRIPLRRGDLPKRNAPCPCNSGKKYKKCCGV